MLQVIGGVSYQEQRVDGNTFLVVLLLVLEDPSLVQSGATISSQITFGETEIDFTLEILDNPEQGVLDVDGVTFSLPVERLVDTEHPERVCYVGHKLAN